MPRSELAESVSVILTFARLAHSFELVEVVVLYAAYAFFAADPNGERMHWACAKSLSVARVELVADETQKCFPALELGAQS